MKNIYENDELGHSENQLIDDGAREEGSASWDGEEESIEDFSSEEGIDNNQLEETPDSGNSSDQEEENAEDSFVEDDDEDYEDYEDSEEEHKNTHKSKDAHNERFVGFSGLVLGESFKSE